MDIEERASLIAEANDARDTPWLECPITRRPFFMNMDHPEMGEVPTFGGPFDSYTIPHVDDDGDLRCERYDHDAGEWVEGGEPVGVYLTTEQPCNHDLPAWLERSREPEVVCGHLPSPPEATTQKNDLIETKGRK